MKLRVTFIQNSVKRWRLGESCLLWSLGFGRKTRTHLRLEHAVLVHSVYLLAFRALRAGLQGVEKGADEHCHYWRMFRQS